MKINLQTDYALRILMYAGANGERLSTIAEIAAAYSISNAHLMKVVHRLGSEGYLDTVRGKNGGMRLNRRPNLIGVGDVVRSIEEDLAVVGCLGSDDYCKIQGHCVLRRALSEATRAFLSVLDKYTLEDLLVPNTALSRLLAIPKPHAR